MNTIYLLRRAACALLVLAAADAGAEALVKSLPVPDTTKLSPSIANQLAEGRAAFEKTKVDLVGNALAQAYADMGALYLRAGFADVADVAFYDAVQLAPNDARWVYLRGVIAREQKHNADARAEFEAALALDKNYLPIQYRLADTLIDLGALDDAHRRLDALLAQHADDATALSMLGRLEVKQQRYAEAVTHLQAALKLEPQANALYADLAAAYRGQGDAQAAQAASAKAGSTPPRLADPLVAGVYAGGSAPANQAAPHGTPLEQAHQLLARRDFGAARDRVGEALKADANDVEALALAARLDALLNVRADAQAEASRALKLKPGSASANLSQGMVYEFAGDDANAFVYYERAVQADPNLPDARLLLGNALMRRGEYARAAEQYRRLAALAPQSENIDARIAAALVAAGRCGEAREGVNRALTKRAQDGNLMQVFVRLTSTCPAASEQERSMALDYAKALYKQRPDASDSSALALAQAAQGKFEDAQKSQAEAIFEAVRAGDSELAKLYRETMRQFAAKQMPDQPWPAGHPFFKPPLLTPVLPQK